MSEDVMERRTRGWEVIAFALIAVLMVWDLAVDYSEGASWTHIAAEMIILVVAAVAALLLWRNLKRARSNLRLAKAEADIWRAENRDLLRGFGTAIAAQFARWKLSEAEAEIGFLLLKGLSHKEIANLRATSERTVREQSRSIYRKSGLAGRANLSAFFLEDVMVCREQPD